MKRPKIVLFTETHDRDADAVIVRLRAAGELPVRVNLDDALNDTFAIRWSGGAPHATVRTRNRTFAGPEVCAAYWRAGSRPLAVPELSVGEHGFAQQETEHGWSALWSTLDCLWVNHPAKAREAAARSWQMRQAAAAGFDVPRTLVASSPDEARSFCEECGGRLVFRAMGDPLVDCTIDETNGSSVRTIWPALVDRPALAEMAKESRNVPGWFQEYVPRQAELRVYVAGDDVWAAEILSEKTESLRLPLHLAHGETDVTVREADLDPELKARCHELVTAGGLAYGVVELIRTPDERYVCLEINPNGRFLPVQLRVPSLKIADSVVTSLLAEVTAPAGR